MKRKAIKKPKPHLFEFGEMHCKCDEDGFRHVWIYAKGSMPCCNSREYFVDSGNHVFIKRMIEWLEKAYHWSRCSRQTPPVPRCMVRCDRSDPDEEKFTEIEKVET